MRTDPVRPDWRAVAIDVTAHCTISPEDAPLIERVITVYAYDANEYTYLCEGTPSHFLSYLYDSVVCTDLTSDEDRERLDAKYACDGGEDTYRHVRSINAIDDAWKRAFGDIPEDIDPSEILDHVREHWLGNCPL